MCARCSATRRPTATGPSGRSRASSRTGASSTACGGSTSPSRAAWSGAHASFTLSDETLAACCEAAGVFGVGLHIHAAEDGADERDAVARCGHRVADRLQPGRRPRRAHAPRARRPPRRRRDRPRPRRRRLPRPQRALQHEQLDRPGPARGAGRAGVTRHRRHRLGHVRGVAHRVLPAARGRRRHRRRLAAAAPRPERAPRGARVRRAAARNARRGRPRRSRRPRLRGADAGARPELRRALGVRPLVAARPRRDGRRRVGRHRPAAHERRPAASWPPRPSARPSGCGGGWTRSGHTSSSQWVPREVSDARHERRPRGALPAGQAPDSRGDGVRQARRGEGLRGRLAGREQARARGDRADGGVRGGDRADRGRLGRRQQLDPQRRPPRRHLLHPRRPRPRPRQARDRRLVGSARGEGRHHAQQAAEGDARDGRGGAPPARDGARDLPRRVRAPGRRRDRHRPRRPLAQERPDLHRRDRR